MKTVLLKDTKPGDIISLNDSIRDNRFCYNIVLNKNKIGVKVLRFCKNSKYLDFLHYKEFEKAGCSRFYLYDDICISIEERTLKRNERAN